MDLIYIVYVWFSIFTPVLALKFVVSLAHDGFTLQAK